MNINYLFLGGSSSQFFGKVIITNKIELPENLVATKTQTRAIPATL